MSQVPSVRTPLSLFDEYMRRQVLSIEDRQRMGIELLDTGRASQLAGFKLRDGRSSFLLPYPGENYYRLRLLGDSARGAAKYLSARGSGSGPVYCPPWEWIDWADVRADVGRMVCIVEGEIKAYWGCRSREVLCVGIGGVDMQDGLFNSSWEWKGRRVLVCFDKDSGWESGTWKPAVARALGRLCSRLEAAGASVWILHLPGEVSEKVGLDDYLRSGGSWDKLLETATVPPEWCEHMAWMLENCVMISGTNHAHIYTIGHGSRKSISDFHDTHVDKVRKGENGKNVAISRLWLHHPDRQTVLNYVMDPLREFGVTGDYLNLWEPFPDFGEVDRGDDAGSIVADWEQFVAGLFGEHWRWIAAWVGHMLERPEEKCTQAVMLVTSVQGIGKSLFGDICRDLMGVHGLECGVERMFTKFNAEMEGKVFVMVNELDVKFSAREGQLNELLTTETVMVEQKGKDVMVFPNLRRWYLTTNTASPCRLSRGQRRVLVVSPPRVAGDTRGEWGEWVRERIARFRRRPGAMAAIGAWFREMLLLHEEQHGRWDPTAPVPETVAGDELALASRTGVQVLADEALEWILEKGVGSIAPVRKKTDAKLVGEIILRCRAAGMIVASKLVKDGGKVYRYTTFEGVTSSPLEKDSSGCFKSHLDGLTVKILDEDLWGALLPLKQQLNL